MAKEYIIHAHVNARDYDKAAGILRERGVEFETWLGLQIKSLIKHSRFYFLRDQLTFGKYEGELLETVIRGDPDYIAWCLRTIAGFGLAPEALELLSHMGVDL